MTKKYISVRNSLLQNEVDNWLLMIPSDRLSSDAKIVYLVLKKIQAPDLTCMTDARSWYKISGLKMNRVRECLLELDRYGLIELYHSTKNATNYQASSIFTVYLLNHFLMKGCYPITDCPHDGDSFLNPQDKENILRNSRVANTMKDFLNQKEQG